MNSSWLIAQFAKQGLIMGPEESIELKNAILDVSRNPKDDKVIAVFYAEQFSGERFDGAILETIIECDGKTLPIEDFLDKPKNVMSSECATYRKTSDPNVFRCSGIFDSKELAFDVTLQK